MIGWYLIPQRMVDDKLLRLRLSLDLMGKSRLACSCVYVAGLDQSDLIECMSYMMLDISQAATEVSLLILLSLLAPYQAISA